jgi:hypothetical protein
VDSLIYRILLAIIGPVIGLIADNVDLPSAFLIMGGVVWFIILGVLWLWRRVE